MPSWCNPPTLSWFGTGIKYAYRYVRGKFVMKIWQMQVCYKLRHQCIVICVRLSHCRYCQHFMVWSVFWLFALHGRYITSRSNLQILLVDRSTTSSDWILPSLLQLCENVLWPIKQRKPEILRICLVHCLYLLLDNKEISMICVQPETTNLTV